MLVVCLSTSFYVYGVVNGDFLVFLLYNENLIGLLVLLILELEVGIIFICSIWKFLTLIYLLLIIFNVSIHHLLISTQSLTRQIRPFLLIVLSTNLAEFHNFLNITILIDFISFCAHTRLTLNCVFPR